MNATGHAIRAGIAGAVVAGLTTGAGAFGDAGHRVVGHLAELHLANTRALVEVRKILAPQETLADASVWPDVIKGPLYEDADTEPFRLEHPAHDTYHYTNLPFQTDRYHDTVPGARADDILQVTRESIRVLKGTSGVFTKREALRLLAHLVGDVHQPLHVGAAYVSAEAPLRFVVPEGSTGWRMTLGGNALRYGPQDAFNLHSYWDSRAVNLAMQNETAPAYATRLFAELGVMPPWRNTGDVESWPERWVNEALEYARDAHLSLTLVAYLGPDAEKRTPHRWRIEPPDAAYDDFARSRVRVQLGKGGYRLAATLRAIWP